VDSQQSSYEKLIAIETIPPLPATAANLLAMAADEDVEIESLAGLIDTDPPLSACMLSVANSAFYSPRRPILTVRDAIIGVLGLNMVRNMALGLALAGGFSSARCPRFDLTAYWVTALGTADLASGLVRASSTPGLPSPEVAYQAGLLHNLGELLLVHLWPAEMDKALAAAAEQADMSLIEHQREIVGMDQWAAGSFLAKHWQLPREVSACMEGFAECDDLAEPTDVCALVRVARRWLDSVAVGNVDNLRVSGVDDAYCEYRSSVFVDRYDDLIQLARSMRTPQSAH